MQSYVADAEVKAHQNQAAAMNRKTGRRSMCACRAMLADAEVKANQDQAEAMNRFRSWATKRVPGAQYMNVGSGPQIRQLLFAGVENQKLEKGVLEHEKVFKVSHSRQQPCDLHQQP